MNGINKWDGRLNAETYQQKLHEEQQIQRETSWL